MLKPGNDLRVFVDTNVFINAMLGDSTSMYFFTSVVHRHRLVLSTSVIQELFEVIQRKFPEKEEHARQFLEILPFELVTTPSFDRTQQVSEQIPMITDPHDVHILVSCWLAECDVLVSQDKHFHNRRIKEKLCVMRVDEFQGKYGEVELGRNSIG